MMMEEAYGIFTTDGETVAGALFDEQAVQLAERLDESTASLYISTKNGTLLLGTAVNVQKKGRRPDTFIYLEKMRWDHDLPPRIDLSFIHDFYRHVEERISTLGYEVRDLASDSGFFENRERRRVTGLSSSHTVSYSVGRLCLGKDVVAVSEDLLKSVDFVVAVTEKLHTFLSPGFTIVIAKRSFRGADLLVTEKAMGTVHLDLSTEEVYHPKWEETYELLALFSQDFRVKQLLSQAQTRRLLEEQLVSEYRKSYLTNLQQKKRFDVFLAEEQIGLAGPVAPAFSSAASVTEMKRPSTPPNEADFKKWTIAGDEQDRLNREYAEHMESKRKQKIRFIAIFGVIFLLLLVVAAIFIFQPHLFSPPENFTQTPHITPSATIAPTGSLIVTQLNTTPGNSPEGLAGFGSAYEIVTQVPQDVTFDMAGGSQPEGPYILMRYNLTTSQWENVNTTISLSNTSAVVLIPDTGIYRFFTLRDDIPETG